MNFGRLSPKQRRLAGYGGNRHRWTLASGPVGAGKTEAALIGFLLYQYRYGGVQFGLLTKGHAQLGAVLKDGVERLLGVELKNHRDGGFELPGANGQTNQLIPLVGQDRRAENRLRSFNLAGMMIDEATTLPFALLGAANARCRVGEGKIVALTNPDGPLHPIKKHYIDQADEKDALILRFELADNPSLTPAYIASLHQHFTGHMLERMVYGRWKAASGLVFPRAADVSYAPPEEEMLAHDVVVDVGESSVTHALLCGRTESGNTWVLDEVCHNHVIDGVLPETELVAKVRRAFAGARIDSWIVDPAAKRFRQELVVQLGRGAVVGKAENMWTEGVEEVNHWIARGALHIQGANVPILMEQLGELIYDPEQAELGKDVPIKIPDHATDCLRYLVLTRAVHESGGKEAWERNRLRQRELT